MIAEYRVHRRSQRLLVRTLPASESSARRQGLIILALCLFASAIVALTNHKADIPSGVHAKAKTADLNERVTESFAQLPLNFEVNQGQLQDKVKFLSRGAAADVFMTSNEIILSRRKANQGGRSRPLAIGGKFDRLTGVRSTSPRAHRVVKMRFVGGRASTIEGLDELEGTVNYFIGKDPKKWHTNVHTYGKVAYREIYPGIDQLFHGNQQQLEYDFLVSPGADPRRIKMAFSGVKNVALDQGDLVLQAKDLEIRLKRPVASQDIDNVKRDIPVRYVIGAKHHVTLQLGAYDTTKPLVIDPILSYSTYLGGSGNDVGFRIALDNVGNTYVTGSTDSPEWSSQGGSNAFIAKLNSAGTARTYLAIIGGSGEDIGFGVAVDGVGNAYVTGTSDSLDFPIANPIQGTFGGGIQDAFVAKLNPSGSALVYSTYLGGSGSDTAFGIAVDPAGSAYITGSTDSPELASLGNTDAFVTKLNPQGSQREYFAILGGSGDDTGFDIAVNSAGEAHVVGATDSTNFTTANAFQPNFGGSQDAFLAKLNSTGSALIYSTYFGGSGNDSGFGIAVDATGNAYITGSTDSPELTSLGGRDAFAAKFSPAGDQRLYLSVVGGAGDDAGFGIAADSSGNAYITGSTTSPNFTTANALQAVMGGAQDCFVAKLNSAGASLTYSTYMGGSSSQAGFSIAVDSSANAYVTGFTSSTNFPTLGPYQAANGGSGDAFILKISPADAPTPTPTATATPGVSPTPTPTPTSIQLILDQSGPASDQVAAVDSVLFLRDPFQVVNPANLLNQGTDRNTRVIVFALNLQLAQGEPSSAVVVNLVDSTNQSLDVPAADVRPVPNFDFTQVVFRLPDNLHVGTCTIKVKAHGQISNSGTIRIRS